MLPNLALWAVVALFVIAALIMGRDIVSRLIAYTPTRRVERPGYRPYGGASETARRARQIERGIIRTN